MSVTMQRNVLVEELSKEARRYPYLANYLKKVIREVGVPLFITGKLPDYLKKASYVNVMYPLGEGIFIHVYMPPGGTESGYRKYIVVEPPKPPRALMFLVESKIAELVTERDIAQDPEEKKKLLLNFLEKVIDVVEDPVNYEELLARKKIPKKVPVYVVDYEYLRYYLIRDKVGLGVLEPFIRDPYIEDISCDGLGYIYIVHKIFGPLETSIKFETEEELDRFVIELSERIGKPVSHARPIVDATLPDGSRINIVFGTDVSLKGSNFTIRKFSKKPLSIIQLVNWGTLDERVAAYLWMLLLEGMSGFISGETASGKTTTLNALITFIRPTAKIITIEDTAEVQVPHENWVRELTRDTGSAESSITMFDLLKAALRQRPNYIVVGEIRGAEGNIAFQAMQSVSWDTPVLIKNTVTGEIKLTPIGAFVDQFYNENEEIIPKFVENYETLSMDKQGIVKWSKIKYVLRHRTKEIYEITYEGKGTIKTTGSHSVFVLDEDSLEVKPKPVSELKEGDLLVTFVKRESMKEYARRILIDVYEILSAMNISRIKVIDEGHIQVRNSNTIPRILSLDKDLAYLLGACIADGCIETKRELKNPTLPFSLDVSENEIADRVVKILKKKFGAEVHVRDRKTYSLFRVYNAPLSYLISVLCGSKLSKKHIPQQLWAASPDVVKAFLEGYMADARRTGVCAGIVVYTTKNKRLALELVWLARIAGFESKMFNNGKYYDVHIRLYGKGRIRPWSEKIPLKPIVTFLERKKLKGKLPLELTYIISRFKRGKQRFITRNTLRKLLRFLKRYSSTFNSEDIKFLRKIETLLKSDIALLKVLKIVRKPYNGYVYDISIPETELFIGGEIPIALHNTGHPVLATFHAGSVLRLIQRITSPPINVPKTQLDNLNFVIIQSAVYREGIMLRRMLSVNEIIGYDAKADSIVYIPVFTWDPSTDRFLFRGRGSSYLLEEKIATIRGIPRREMKLIYKELDLRARIIRELVNKKVFDYYRVFGVISKIYNIIDEKLKGKGKEETQYTILEGLEEALKKLRRNELVS